jgi:hypothetical protein
LETKFVNLTPHDIVVQLSDGSRRVFAKSGVIARVATTSLEDGSFDGIPVVRTTFGEVENLPVPEEGTVYIVSALVLSALAGSRSDVVAPNTGSTAIRNEKGLVEAVVSFTR